MNAHEETLGILKDTCFEPCHNVDPENTMSYIMVKGRVHDIYAQGVASAQQSVYLTALRRWLTLSIFINVILLAVVAFTIGGR